MKYYRITAGEVIHGENDNSAKAGPVLKFCRGMTKNFLQVIGAA
jgi:hypothetical protein